MNITVVGGGPGGLFFSILVKKAWPQCNIKVLERNKADDAFGFGVVFSDETLSEFLSRDTGTYELIRDRFAYWDELDVVRNGEKARITGNGFCGCSRKTLLQILQQRCREEGVDLHFETIVDDPSVWKDADMVVICDGIGSGIRSRFATEFGTKVEMKKNRFVWLGSARPLDAFAYFFRETEWGTFVAHTYQYEEGHSTWIIETSDEAWQKAGFTVDDEAGTIAKVSEIFKEELAGYPLISNKSHWRQFPLVTNTNWHHGNMVLMGDAKASAHYSIGSGTKLAMEGAIGLADAVLQNRSDVPAAFQAYEKKRRNPVSMIQHAANVSLEWFEQMDRHIKQDFMTFAFSVMTRSKKVTFDNQALRDPQFAAQVLENFNSKENKDRPVVSPAFIPYRLRDLDIPNRVMMSAMGQYKAIDGLVNDWHLMHYGARATGGVGLIMTEMAAASPDGRITVGCPGIWSDEQTTAWKRIVDFVHQHTNAKIGMQIGHGGRKGASVKPWEGRNQPISNPWELLSASPLPFDQNWPTPKEMTEADMDRITDSFVLATQNATKAGFDMLEFQAHHGFLFASFLSPLTNQRTDSFGGSIENRLRFPVRVFKAMREVFPKQKPMSVRFTACDWAENGITESDVLAIARAFKEAGADILNVSTGGTVENQQPATGRMWQTPFSDFVRNEVGIPTITSGFISSMDQVNTLLLNRRADLVALGRPLLLDASFVRNAQAWESVPMEYLHVPEPYQIAVPHQFAIAAGERKAMLGMKKALKPLTHKKS